VGNFKELEGRGFLGGGDLGFSGAWVQAIFIAVERGPFRSFLVGHFQELEHGNFQK
jgi:hypothetical protein